MTSPAVCSKCGTKSISDAKFCAKCGAKCGTGNKGDSGEISEKSAVTTLLLCIFLGSLGIHRFYVGKIKTGILMLLTGGGLGIWTLIDLVMIACCDFTDKNGKYLVFTRGRAAPLKLILIIVGSVVAALITMVTLLVTLVLYLTSPMIDTIQGQLAAIRANEMDKAYSYFAEETKNSVSMKDFSNYVASYPIMHTNINASFSQRSIQNGEGYAKGTLTASDGAKAAIEYTMKKENDVWKVVALRISDADNNTGTNTASSAADDKGNKIFDGERYTINYPAAWDYDQPDKRSILFSGKKGSASYYTTVSIQVIPSKETGGAYSSVKEAISDLKNQISSQATNVKFLTSGQVELPTDKKYHGESFVVTYDYKGHAMKKMLFIITSDNGTAFYAFGYTSPDTQYDVDLPVAKAMYESWKIK
jgi:TM2 domain-containing membrane protein YozV